MSEVISAALTHTQRAIWTLQRIDPSSDIFCCCYAASVDTSLDPALLGEAVRKTVLRHEALRTTFPASGGRPTPEIHPKMEIPIEWHNVGLETDAELIDHMMAKTRRPYNLERGPLLRVSVFVRNSGEHVLLLEIHHLAVDWLSARLVMEELEGTYRGLRTGVEDALPPVPCQFREHAEWQNTMLAGEAGSRHEAYWRERLNGNASDLSIPTDRPRPKVEVHQGSTYFFEVPCPLISRLEEVARSGDATLFSVLLAAFGVLLHRYSEAASIAIGTHTSGRVRRALDSLVGPVSNPIPILVAFAPEISFSYLAREVSRSVRGALRHQFYPLALMTERIERPRDPGRTPLFQALFNLNRDEPLLLETPAWRHDAWLGMSLRNQEGQFELKLMTYVRRDGSLTAALQYHTTLYDRETIARLARAWITMLEDAAANPQCGIARLQLLDAEEKTRVLQTWNQTARDYPRDSCIHELVRAQCRRSPDAPAVSDDAGLVTYSQLMRRVDVIASNLRRAGAQSGSVIGISLPPSIDQVATLLAVLETGAAYLPLDPAHPLERRRGMLEDAAATLVIGDDRTLEGLSATPALSIDQLTQQPEGELPAPDVAGQAGDRLAYVLFTSGSTGRPKGVEITHRSVVNLVTAMQDLLTIGPSDTWLSITTLSFDIAALEIFLPLITGARLVMADRAVAGNGARLYDEIERHAVTVLQATPTSWRLLEAAKPGAMRPLKRLCGGEQLSRALADQLLHDPGPLWNVYGPTETTIWSTASRVSAGSRAPSIGRPLANTQVYVFDRHMQPVPVGVVGDLWIGGDGVARGYVGLPDLTAEVFVPDPFAQRPGARLYRTGDLARWLASGELEFAGRMDHQLKIRGIRIELGEIEAALLAQPDISEAVVVAVEEDDADPRLVSYLVLKPGRSLNSSLVRIGLRRRLPDYMIPSSLIVLPRMPLTPNGKIDRRALPDPKLGPKARTPFVEPRTPLEAKLARLVAEVLRVQRVGIDDDFFDLGGASLASLDFARRAEEVGIPLEPEAVFEHRTVRALAAILGRTHPMGPEWSGTHAGEVPECAQ